ncbi:hypothetical protein GCM10025867_18890 [Frondihabitans sucicola]|uniref:LapA family protein n=1 Tax=Frondihabitans sucicola TaxID=1268041 RepID=A0ABM8GMJ0_9MICO|nr:hypothetical protein [Frondihabitans sucicola]BDZ49648.1 hypothetical protein GCM10025867_18890 [Frondihabitans sucicola]
MSLLTLATIVLAETANPSSPAGVQTVPDNQVTPGWIGFLAIFGVGVATVFLIIDMTRRVRRTRYRGEIREQIELERQEAARAAEGLDDELRDGGHVAEATPGSPTEPR